MSESEVVGKIIDVLVQEKGFEKGTVLRHPNQKDIRDQAICEILSQASKQNTKNEGKLDLFYLNKKDELIILGEVKEYISNHQQAIKDTKHYLNFFLPLNSYKIVGLAISGETISNQFNYQIDTFIIKEERVIDSQNQQLLSKGAYLDLFLSANNKEENELEKKVDRIGREVSELLMGLTVAKKPIVVAGALITLFQPERKKEKTIHRLVQGVIKNLLYQNLLQKEKLLEGDDIENLGEEIKKNFLLGEKSDLVLTLKESFPSSEKEEVSQQRDNKIKTVSEIIKAVIQDGSLENVILTNVFIKICQIKEIISSQKYDLSAKFYKTFLKHWSGDGQDLGIVLTPRHITDLMVDLIEIFKGDITPQDVCLDPCSGTGTFLLSFFDKQVSKYKNIEKAKENLIGIEKNEEMYVLSVANMLSHGDGKANLYLEQKKGCFSFNSTSFPRTPNIGLMNPPYSQTKKKIGDNKSEIEFVEKLGECIKNGYFAVIVPLSTFTNKTEVNINKRKNIYRQHTLKAIINMPEKLFSPISIHTCVAIFQSEKSHTLADQVYFYNLEYDGYEINNEVRQDYFKKWGAIKEKVLTSVRNKEEIKGQSFSLNNIKAEDEWTFNFCRRKKETKENFSVLFTEGGKLFFEKTISDFLLYKIKEKTGILDLELRINEAKIGKNKDQIQEIDKQRPSEWIIIHNYLLYKWKEKEKVFQLQAEENNLPNNFQFLKKLVFSDLDLPEIDNITDEQRKELNTNGLASRQWKEFQVKQIFITWKKEKNTRREDINWGDYYYVTRSEKNNGIWCKSDKYSYEGKIITMDSSAGSGVSFYQDKPFLTNGMVHKLKLVRQYPSLNVYRGLFLNTILSLNRKYYNYGGARNKSRLEEEWIMLPVNQQGEPDWDFMDIYIYIYI